MNWLHANNIKKEATELASKPLAERESALWEASESYMSGKISLQDLKRVERPYLLLEYAKSVGALNVRSRPPSLFESIVQLFKLPQ